MGEPAKGPYRIESYVDAIGILQEATSEAMGGEPWKPPQP